jgi:hypothetical protein
MKTGIRYVWGLRESRRAENLLFFQKKRFSRLTVISRWLGC